jgi:hypothetical protein
MCTHRATAAATARAIHAQANLSEGLDDTKDMRVNAHYHIYETLVQSDEAQSKRM